MRRRVRIQPWWVLGGTLALLFIVLVITYVAGERNVTVTETVVGESVSPLMSWTQKRSRNQGFFRPSFRPQGYR
jgi:hypothetical protein